MNTGGAPSAFNLTRRKLESRNAKTGLTFLEPQMVIMKNTGSGVSQLVESSQGHSI